MEARKIDSMKADVNDAKEYDFHPLFVESVTSSKAHSHHLILTFIIVSVIHFGFFYLLQNQNSRKYIPTENGSSIPISLISLGSGVTHRAETITKPQVLAPHSIGENRKSLSEASRPAHNLRNITPEKPDEPQQLIQTTPLGNSNETQIKNERIRDQNSNISTPKSDPIKNENQGSVLQRINIDQKAVRSLNKVEANTRLSFQIAIDSEQKNKSVSYSESQLYAIQNLKPILTINSPQRDCVAQIKKVIKEQNRVAKPCERRIPEFPKDVRSSGSCIMQYDISPTGLTQNIEVLNCTDSIFKSVSIEAVEHWYFFPINENLNRVETPNHRTKITYKLTDQNG